MNDLLAPPARRGRALRAAAVAVVLVAIGIGALFGSRLTVDPTLVASPLIGRPVPDVTLPALEGPGEVSLAALRGQVVVVNFWASWWVAYREEHAALVGAADQYRDAGVTFVGVAYQDSTSSAVAFSTSWAAAERTTVRQRRGFPGPIGVRPVRGARDLRRRPRGHHRRQDCWRDDLPAAGVTLDAVIAGDRPGPEPGSGSARARSTAGGGRCCAP